MHEQSETIERDGKFFNVYGAATPRAGKVLPGEPAYNTLEEAVTAAKTRSERYGHEHRDNNMGAPSQADVRKVDIEMAKKAEKPPSNYQEVVDAKTRALEEKAKTTKTGMGDKLFAKGGSIRGGGCESRGKTKGRMV